ncbi:MAG TPA: alcohol dehydrogenase catalytic domain-containing protein [Candidatus Binatia bacterium]|nr:alcohol dehydrogenase catalytic domain-containing protein [Candidatus Binatia bacterium]
MAEKTLAAVLVAPRQIELREFPLPEVDEDSGLARVEITGVCGADWPIYTGDLAKFAQPPLIPGHEIVARVEKIGARAAARWGVQEGDRIVMEEYAPCGHCEFCLSGRYYMCSGMKMEKMYGFTSLNVPPGLWGGYSEYVFLDPQALVHKIAESVPTNVAPFYVPLANGIRWAHLEGGVGIGSTVVIQGPGGQGLACVIAANEAGAANIIITGRSRDGERLKLAREFGAHHTVDVDAVGDVIAHVGELTEGHMADTVINVTAYFPGALQQAAQLARIGGTIVVAGEAHGLAADFEPDLLFLKELTIKGVRGRTSREMKKGIKLLESGKYPLHKLATHHFMLDEVAEAIQTVGGQGDPGSIHVSVLPRLRT